MEEQVISISEIIDAVKKRWKIIALTTVLATLVSGIFSFFVISPTYEASTKIFIGKEGAESEGYNSSDVSMYQNLIKTYFFSYLYVYLIFNNLSSFNLKLLINIIDIFPFFT